MGRAIYCGAMGWETSEREKYAMANHLAADLIVSMAKRPESF